MHLKCTMMRLAMYVVAVTSFAMATAASAQQGGGKTAPDYDRTGEVRTITPSKVIERVGSTVADSVGGGASTTAGWDKQVALPGPCDFDNTMMGCPGYVAPPPVDPCDWNPTAAGCPGYVTPPPVDPCDRNPTAAGCSGYVPPTPTDLGTSPDGGDGSGVKPPDDSGSGAGNQEPVEPIPVPKPEEPLYCSHFESPPRPSCVPMYGGWSCDAPIEYVRCR